MSYYVADMLGSAIQQTLGPMRDYFLPKVSPTWSEIQTQNTKVARIDDVGLNWIIQWPFMIGLAGSVQPAPMTAPLIATDPSTPAPPDFQLPQDQESWPGLAESPYPGLWTQKITLKRIKADCHFPREFIRLASLNAYRAIDPMDAIIKGWARNIARSMCMYWFSQTGNSLVNAIGSFTAAVGVGLTIDSTGLAITLDTAGTSNAVPNSFAKLASGMAVDIFLQNANVRLNAAPVFIGKPKGLNRTATYPGHCTLYCFGASITLTDTYVYHIVPRGSGRESGTSYLPTPLEAMFASSGAPTNLFNINTTLFPHLQSVVSTTAIVATEASIQKCLAEQEMYATDLDDDMRPDTFLMTPGIMARYFQNYELWKVGNAGQTFDVSGGVANKITYQLYGRTYNFVSERWLPQKHMYLIKLKNNWQVVRPPRMKGTKSSPGFDQGLEFLAPLWGHPSIFIHAYQTGGGSAGAFTGWGHCPAEMIYEVIPEKFGGWFKWTAVTESYNS
jgi:hypothetical protein